MTSPHIRMDRKTPQKHEFWYLRSLQEDLSLLFVFPLFLNSLQLLKKTKLGANVRRLFVIFFILDRGGRKEIFSWCQNKSLHASGLHAPQKRASVPSSLFPRLCGAERQPTPSPAGSAVWTGWRGR